MTNYNINYFDVNDETIYKAYESEKAKISFSSNWNDLDCIFNVAMMDKRLFPKIRLGNNATIFDYIEMWIKWYIDGINNLPHNRKAKPKSACNDPAISVIVQETQGISESKIKKQEAVHNLFMSAENIQGNLLEEYIAVNVRKYGFIWCAGTVMHAVDFCNIDGTCLLQVKNKSNTENSSSSDIRSGTNIIKWYRVATGTKHGKKYPKFKWDVLNKLIYDYSTIENIPYPNLNEEMYQIFLRSVASKNKDLITYL